MGQMGPVAPNSPKKPHRNCMAADTAVHFVRLLFLGRPVLRATHLSHYFYAGR